MNGRDKKPLEKLSPQVCFAVIISSGLIAAEALMVPHHYPASKCIGIGQVRVPTRDAYLPDANYTAFSAQAHQVVSEIVCAAQTFTHKAVSYSYQDGVCTVYGVHERVYHEGVFFVQSSARPAKELEEVAHLKNTYAVPHYANWRKEMAVDGRIDNSMYHSDSGLTTPWWIVDLGEVRTIHQVQIFTRQDCCSERLHDVEVRVGRVLRVNGDLIPFTLMSTYGGPYNITEGHIICTSLTGVTGRFLSLQKISSDQDHLQLSEVKVYATKLI
ncbi:uncharacterized protein [Macrobrachium rosenbergii]